MAKRTLREDVKNVDGLVTDQSHTLAIKSTRGVVRVRLLDRDDQPLAGAPCRLLQEGSPIGEGETDEAGEVLWTDLRMTWYEVEATAPDGTKLRTGVPWLKDDLEPHLQHLPWPPEQPRVSSSSTPQHEPLIVAGQPVPDRVVHIRIGGSKDKDEV